MQFERGPKVTPSTPVTNPYGQAHPDTMAWQYGGSKDLNAAMFGPGCECSDEELRFELSIDRGPFSSPHLRINALCTLIRRARPDVCPEAIEIIQSDKPDWDLLWAALESLRGVPRPAGACLDQVEKCIDGFLERADSRATVPFWRVIEAGMDALHHHGRSMRPFLIRAASRGAAIADEAIHYMMEKGWANQEIAKAAIDVARSGRGSHPYDCLAQLMWHKDPGFREAAFRLIASAPEVAVMIEQELVIALRDPSAAVRAAVREAIKTAGPGISKVLQQQRSGTGIILSLLEPKEIMGSDWHPSYPHRYFSRRELYAQLRKEISLSLSSLR